MHFVVLGSHIATGEPHFVCPNKYHHEKARARREAVTAEQRELIDKRRRDAYHAKKMNRPQLSADQLILTGQKENTNVG